MENYNTNTENYEKEKELYEKATRSKPARSKDRRITLTSTNEGKVLTIKIEIPVETLLRWLGKGEGFL